MKRRIHLDYLIHCLNQDCKTSGWHSSGKYHTFSPSDSHKCLQAVIEATVAGFN